MKEFFQNHKWAVVLSAVAIITVLLIYLIGWWTLLAAAFVAIAIFFGGVQAVKDFFARLFKGKNA